MRHLRSVAPYSLRLAAMAFQLITIAVLPNLLSGSDLGSYFLLVALVSSLIPLFDVGFIRYSYKYIHRYGLIMRTPIIRRMLASLAITLPVCIAFLYLYIDRWYVFIVSLLYLLGVVIGRLLQINKYFLVVSSRALAAAVFDAMPTMLLALGASIAFVIGLVAMDGREFPLWFTVSMTPMAFLVAYALSIRYLPALPHGFAVDWCSFRAAGAPSNLVRSMRRTWPVAADAFFVTQVINLPLLILGARTQPDLLVLVGLFTRVFAAYATVVAVFSLINLPRFYGPSSLKSVMARYTGMSLVLFVGMVGALFALRETITLSIFNDTELEIIRLLTPLTEFMFALPICFGLYFLYIAISNVALAANAPRLRIVSTLTVLCVVATAIFSRTTSPTPGTDTLGVVLLGLNVGLTVGLLLMSSVLLKRHYLGSRRRLLPKEV